ncbi:MAG: M20/M25/M40 family metallo-hydrolase [Clostridia bacterium]|nr:M20/M25/M40 family metallo-hydrolase [Clostridia bacterium]
MKSKKWIIPTATVAAAGTAVVAKAAAFKPKKIVPAEVDNREIDVKKVAEHLSKAIQCKTISMPYDEGVDWGEFDKLQSFLDEAYPNVAKTLTKETIGKASLLYRWEGKNPELEPMALLSHQDVVPVAEGTEKDWTYDAFSGHIDDEFIWGRGALDMKNHLICVMEAVETLIEDGFQPDRDVYLCFGHNEETVASSCSGANSIVQTFVERGIHLDSVLDEGSALLRLDIPGLIHTYIAAIGTAEKGYVDMKITMHDKGGHTSASPKHSGMAKLANAVQDLENNQFQSHWLPFLDELFGTIGRHATLPGRIVMSNLPILRPVVKKVMSSIGEAASMVRTVTSVSQCEGSPAPNVLPQRPSITANFRMLPGDTTEDVEAHIRKVIKNKDIEIERFSTKEATKFSPTDSRAFKAIESVEEAFHPGEVAVAPFLVMGGTDACFYEPVCENILRFAPFNVTLELFLNTHATNERLPIAALDEAVRFFREYIKKASNEN